MDYEENNDQLAEEGVSEEPESYQIGEESYTSDQIGEWQKVYNDQTAWNQKNTQAAQELSDERNQLGKVRELNEMLEKNPDLYDKVQGVFDGYNQPQQNQPNQPEQPQIPKEFVDKMRALEQRADQSDEANAMAKLDKDMGDVQTKYPQFFEGNEDFKYELADFALKNNILNVEHALRAMKFDDLQTQKLNEGQQMGTNAQNRQKQVQTPGGSKAKSGSGYNPRDKNGNNKGWDSLEEAMMNDPSIT